MNMFALLFDLAPVGGGGVAIIAGAAAVAVFLLLVGVAAVAFFALRKILKIGFRLAIVAVILVIAFVGSASLLYFGVTSTTDNPSRRRGPPIDRPR